MSERSRQRFKDREHLVRMAGIFAIGVVLFVVLQRMLVPATFGQYGHYRGSAIADSAAHPLVFGGRASCGTCHAAAVAMQKDGRHARLGCEACHGALGNHARDPKSQKPATLDTKKLCPVCHAINAARPAWFKQVNVAEHSSGEACNTCHQPHAPQM
jgi:hypothetical protein